MNKTFVKEFKKQDTNFMNNIDMKALKKGIKNSEDDIANGRIIQFEEAMAQIHKEVFND